MRSKWKKILLTQKTSKEWVDIGSTVFVIGLSSLVLMGHILHWVRVTNISPDFVSMKIPTAILFLITGLHMWKRSKVMEYAFLVSFVGTTIYIILPNLGNEIMSTGVQESSIGTMVAFALTYGLMKTEWATIREALVLVSSVAMIGYVADSPQMYYYFEGISTAMALHTAWLFLHIAIFYD